MREEMWEVMDRQKDSERFSGHKSLYNQPPPQHRMKSMNKTRQIDELICARWVEVWKNSTNSSRARLGWAQWIDGWMDG